MSSHCIIVQGIKVERIGALGCLAFEHGTRARIGPTRSRGRGSEASPLPRLSRFYFTHAAYITAFRPPTHPLTSHSMAEELRVMGFPVALENRKVVRIYPLGKTLHDFCYFQSLENQFDRPWSYPMLTLMISKEGFRRLEQLMHTDRSGNQSMRTAIKSTGQTT